MQDTITVKANATYAVEVSGAYLNIISCTAAFKVEMDHEGQNVGLAGASFAASKGKFRRLVFTETSGADNTITFDASDTPSPGRPVSVQAAAATFVGANSGPYTLGVETTFPGIDSAQRARKVMFITNEEAAGSGKNVNVRVGTKVVMSVFPQTVSPPIETNADLKLAPNGLNTVGIDVLEIFYSKPLQTDQ